MLYILWKVTIEGEIDLMLLYVRRDTKTYLFIVLELYKLYFLNRTDLKLFGKKATYLRRLCLQDAAKIWIFLVVVKYKGVVIL